MFTRVYSRVCVCVSIILCTCSRKLNCEFPDAQQLRLEELNLMSDFTGKQVKYIFKKKPKFFLDYFILLRIVHL